jgi:hypothetical protein
MEPETRNSENQHQLTIPAKPGRARNRIQQRHQAAALQRFAFDAAMSLKQTCTDEQSGTLTVTPQMATAIYRLIGSWDTARDALRVLRGRGLPASVRPKTRAATMIQPLDPV